MLLLVSGNWHALAKLETELEAPRRDQQPEHASAAHRAARAAHRHAAVLDRHRHASIRPASSRACPGFFATRGIDIAEVSTRSYPAAHTGAPMFAVQMIVNVPSRIHVAQLREEFMEFCDSLNLDAILEPVKS